MKNLNCNVQSEYNYAYSTYSPSASVNDGILSELDVFNAHFALADFFESSGEDARYGILNFGLLSSAVARQSVSFCGKCKWKDDESKVSTLAFGLDKNHAFNDGNKRTALLCLLLALHRKKRHLVCKKSKLETLLIRIAANEMDKYPDFKKFRKHGDDAVVMYMSKFLRKNSRKIDNSFRTMTFEEFNRKLKKYGVKLDNAQGSFINVYQKKEKNFLGFISKNKEVRILQIGFPGWKRQINPKAVKNVLKESGLIDKGLDMKTFYEGGEPEYKLIEEYYTVLRRLKDE